MESECCFELFILIFGSFVGYLSNWLMFENQPTTNDQYVFHAISASVLVYFLNSMTCLMQCFVLGSRISYKNVQVKLKVTFQEDRSFLFSWLSFLPVNPKWPGLAVDWRAMKAAMFFVKWENKL